MEKKICARLGSDTVVLPVIGAAGNINHFDFTRRKDQTSYDEANRLAAAYADTVLGSLRGKARVDEAGLGAAATMLRIPGIEISPEDAARARGVLAETRSVRTDRDLTAEDIFHGDPSVERMFALALLELADQGPVEHQAHLQVFRLGPIGFCAVPGEPFVEIGLALKRLKGFELVVPVGLANGYVGYIPLAESFDRGGYEVKPGPALLCRDGARRIMAELARLASPFAS